MLYKEGGGPGLRCSGCAWASWRELAAWCRNGSHPVARWARQEAAFTMQHPQHAPRGAKHQPAVRPSPAVLLLACMPRAPYVHQGISTCGSAAQQVAQRSRACELGRPTWAIRANCSARLHEGAHAGPQPSCTVRTGTASYQTNMHVCLHCRGSTHSAPRRTCRRCRCARFAPPSAAQRLPRLACRLARPQRERALPRNLRAGGRAALPRVRAGRRLRGRRRRC